MTETVVALVPMKANSNRVPRKNLRTFNGRPLFHWILATLESVDSVDEIVVNTDSEMIATEASDLFDVTIIDRPEELRADETPMNDILLHDIEQVNADVFLQTHCTNPLLRPETVSEAIQAYYSQSCDSIFSVTPFQTRFWTDDGEPVNHERDRLIPTQRLTPLHEENSNVYLFTAESLRERKNRIGDEPKMFEMQQEEAVDIDEMIDFKIAELLHKHIYGESPDPMEVANMERPPEMES